MAINKRIRLIRPRPAQITTPRPKQPTGPTLLDAIADPHLFKPWFRDPRTWEAWFAFIAALFGLPMTAEQSALYRQCTGRDDIPQDVAREAWLVCGRRAGKSFVLALIAVFLAAFHDYREHLAPGERGVVFLIATDRKQARIVLRYIRALLSRIPMLARMIEREWAEGFDLTNGVSIEVATASFRSVRGYTFVAVLLDELAFWPTDDTAQPDFEVLNALRPGMATIPNAMLLAASSPYAKRGSLWDAHRRHYGKGGDPVLVWQAATRVMNPSVPQSVIDEAIERDSSSASAEYLAQFRSDIEAFLSRDAVEGVISTGTFERGVVANIKYSGFTDFAGGSGSDSATLAIAHKEEEVAFLDAIRERKPPFSPEAVVAEFAVLLKEYGISKIIGDRFAGQFPVEAFKKHGISLEASAKPKSDLYREFLPLVNSRKVDLLDNAKMLTQLVALERRTARSGKDSIDHAPNGHDDVANAVAGALTTLSARKYAYDTSLSWVGNYGDQSSSVQRVNSFIMTGGFFR